MRLLKDPKASLLIRMISLAAAILIAALIARLVFAFGYYASGLASYQEDQRRRRATPILLQFADPNAPADANAAVADANTD